VSLFSPVREISLEEVTKIGYGVVVVKTPFVVGGERLEIEEIAV
jgi:hypothetical protein